MTATQRAHGNIPRSTIAQAKKWAKRTTQEILICWDCGKLVTCTVEEWETYFNSLPEILWTSND